jgi:hypothetical protein
MKLADITSIKLAESMNNTTTVSITIDRTEQDPDRDPIEDFQRYMEDNWEFSMSQPKVTNTEVAFTAVVTLGQDQSKSDLESDIYNYGEENAIKFVKMS